MVFEVELFGTPRRSGVRVWVLDVDGECVAAGSAATVNRQVNVLSLCCDLVFGLCSCVCVFSPFVALFCIFISPSICLCMCHRACVCGITKYRTLAEQHPACASHAAGIEPATPQLATLRSWQQPQCRRRRCVVDCDRRNVERDTDRVCYGYVLHLLCFV